MCRNHGFSTGPPYSPSPSFDSPLPHDNLCGFLRLTAFQLTTLRPPIRANPSTRGFAGGRNVGERSEQRERGEPRRGRRRAAEERQLGVRRWKPSASKQRHRHVAEYIALVLNDLRVIANEVVSASQIRRAPLPSRSSARLIITPFITQVSFSLYRSDRVFGDPVPYSSLHHL